MPIWKIAPEGPVQVSETKLKQEKLLEKHLEDVESEVLCCLPSAQLQLAGYWYTFTHFKLRLPRQSWYVQSVRPSQTFEC